MLSPISPRSTPVSSRASSEETPDVGTCRDENSQLVPSGRRTKVDSMMANIEVLVDEIVSKREAWNKSSRTKRKHPSKTIDLESYLKLREYITVELEDLQNDNYAVTEIRNSADEAPLGELGLNLSVPLASPDASFSPRTPSTLPFNGPMHFPEYIHSSSRSSPPLLVIDPPRSSVLDLQEHQELFQYYLEVPAVRLADTSPSYIDLFRRYIPAMAQESPALMESLIALAAIQREVANGGDNTFPVKAIRPYQRALQMHFNALQQPDALSTDAPTAISLMLSHFELWNGELIKMGVHMNGCRDIICARGKMAHMTPIGRALLAAFRRLDVSSSAISGNPSFHTDDWWTVDPLTRTPIAADSPPLLAADAAFSKLCVICSRLCHLKAWIIRRRREVHQQTLALAADARAAQKAALEAKIDRKISRLELDLEEWLMELPPMFAAPVRDGGEKKDGEQEEEEEEEDADINTTTDFEITPKRYKHKAVGLVVAYGLGVRLQLWRLRNPDAPVVSEEMGRCCHSILRIFEGLPESCDAAMTVPLFAAGIELRQPPHQEHLLAALAARAARSGCHALRFVRDGVRFALLKLAGARRGAFVRIKAGAAARIAGVSENLWSADGMLRSMAALSLYDDAPGTGTGTGTGPRTAVSPPPPPPPITFQGDFGERDGDGDDDEVPYERASRESSSRSYDSADDDEEEAEARKRRKSESPVVSAAAAGARGLRSASAAAAGGTRSRGVSVVSIASSGGVSGARSVRVLSADAEREIEVVVIDD